MRSSFCSVRAMVYSATLIVLAVAPAMATSITLTPLTSFPAPSGGWTGSTVYHLNRFSSGPRFAVVWGRAASPYDENMVEIYDVNMNLLYEFHTSTSHPAPFTGTHNYSKITNVSCGDTDQDGNFEVVVLARASLNNDIDKGVYLMEWNGSTMVPVWRYAGPATAFQHAVEIGNFYTSTGREVAFGNNEGYIYVLNKSKVLQKTLTISGTGKTVQNIRANDTNANGYDELYVSTGRNPGRVHRYERSGSNIVLAWSTNVTALSGSGDNCYEIWPHASGHPSGGWGIGGVTEKEEGTVAGSMFVLNTSGAIQWQYVHPSDTPRAGGCEYRDMTGDGLPDLLTRGAEGTYGLATLIRDRSGNLVMKDATPDGSTVGPYRADYQADGTYEVLFGGAPCEFWRVNTFASPPDFQMAHGVIALTTSWQTFSLPAGFSLPIVVLGPTTNSDPEPVITRLQNVTASSFEAKIVEWGYQDNVHATEEVHWIAVERGVWDLGSGKYIVARDAIISGDDVGYVLPFGLTFPSTPAAIATVATAIAGGPVTDRISSTTTTGITIRLQEEEAQGPHNGETINYIACDTTVTDIAGTSVEVYRSPATEVDENPLAVTTSFGTCNIWLDEEQSADSEVDHTLERMAYIALEGSPFLVGDCITRNEADTCVLRCDSP